MKTLLIFAAAVTLSTSVLAGNMSDNKGMKAIHSQMMDKSPVEEILQNEDMQRLHRDMTLYAMSEGGFEARVQMMTDEGRAYHKALKQSQKKYRKVILAAKSTRGDTSVGWLGLQQSTL